MSMMPFYRPCYDHRELWAMFHPGPARSAFESTVAARAGVRYGIAFAYGHSGLIAALKALEFDQAEVILPAYTCAVMARAVIASGNRPVFVDVDLADFNMDLRALRPALTANTRAVVATHMFGYPADVDAIRSAIGDKRVLIIEDSALSLHNLSAQGRGLRGDIGLLSLGIGKPLSTFKGGILLTDSSERYQRIKVYRDKNLSRGIRRSQVKRLSWMLASYLAFRNWSYPLWHRRLSGSSGYKSEAGKLPDLVPSDYAMRYPDFQARVGLVQVAKVDEMIRERRTLAEQYDRELANVAGLYPAPTMPRATYSYYTVRIPHRDEADIRSRMRARGVAVDQVFDYVLPCLPPFQQYAHGTFPRAEQAAREVVNLPIYPGLNGRQVLYISDCLRQVVR